MQFFQRRLGAVIAASAMVAASIALCPSAAQAAVPDLGQHVAVPAYIPTSDSASWSSLTTANSQLGFIVANVNTGPDSAVNSDEKSKIDATHNAGTRVLGYVDTGYLGGSSPVRRTVNGDTDLTSWVVQTEQDIDRWYQFYGSSVDGIFLDDGMNVCGTSSNSTLYVDAYKELNDYIHTLYPGSLTVLNPGITVPDCYDNTADILVTYEGNATDYLNPPANRATAQWQLDGDPNHFWHIIHTVSTAQESAVLQATKTNNAGYVYLTSDTDPNPYDTAPTGTYWSSELSGTAAVATTAPATPSQPYSSDVYSTGAVINWKSSSSSNVVGYDVYRGGIKVASVGNYYPTDTNFTDVGLTPSTSYSYTVKARHRDGKQSAASTALAIRTDVVWGNAPDGPGALTATNVTANAVRLTWNASTVTNDPVAFYDVYVNGVRKTTLDSATTSIHLGYLLQNTAYSITVKARSTSNAVSASSAAATFTTPNPVPIDNASVLFNASTAQFVARYNLTYTYQNVFIDTDGSTTTGYPVGGIGADYLIENGTFYQHLAGTTGFDWTAVTLDSGPLTSVDNGTYTWQVPSSQFGSTTTLKVVFNGQGNSPDATLPVITATR